MLRIVDKNSFIKKNSIVWPEVDYYNIYTMTEQIHFSTID